MSKFFDSWAHAHRLSRAVFMAMFAGGLLVWALWFGPPPRVSRATQTGQVVSVAEGGVTVITLADGKQVRVMAKVAMKAGDSVPMIVETYEDGSIVAFVDEQAWRMR
jgi:low affinity Fe/Cu permease